MWKKKCTVNNAKETSIHSVSLHPLSEHPSLFRSFPFSPFSPSMLALGRLHMNIKASKYHPACTEFVFSRECVFRRLLVSLYISFSPSLILPVSIPPSPCPAGVKVGCLSIYLSIYRSLSLSHSSLHPPRSLPLPILLLE